MGLFERIFRDRKKKAPHPSALMTTDQISRVASDDAQMEAAIRKAKDTFQQFLDAFCEPTEKQEGFLVKAVFVEGEQVEHVWLADLDFTGKLPRGVVGHEPQIPSLKFMHMVEFEPSQITDWMYIEDGYLVGGYTTRVIRDRMTREQRVADYATVPYKFREIV